jgi:hypothetical protein
MDTLQFCYWLQGFAEINGEPPTEAQWKTIIKNLNFILEDSHNMKKPVYRDSTSLKNYKPHDDWTKVRFENVPAKEQPDAYL